MGETNSTSHSDELTSTEHAVIELKHTEKPFSGKFYDHFEEGVYACRKCGNHLYSSSSKFRCGCGWPAFDAEMSGHVKRSLDADGHRVEITCSSCGGHLGHVFEGEGLTATNTRHCVNSVSLSFVPKETDTLQTAIFACGCFWGVSYYRDTWLNKSGAICTV